MAGALRAQFHQISRVQKRSQSLGLLSISEVRMKSQHIMSVALAVSLMLGAVVAAIPQSTPAPQPQPDVPPTSASLGAPDQGFNPGFADLMVMLVQPRHLKLYYAGTRKNWELAASESRDLRNAFHRIAVAFPNYLGNGVDEAVGAIIAPKMQAVDAAIAAADSKQFAKVYNDLTAACNACHTYMEHPFLVIKVPDSATNPVYPDQDFSASP
jgi:hypothetical protein